MSFSGIAWRLPRLWYRPQLAVALLPLLPLSWLFRLIVWLRHGLYRCGVLRSFCLPVPVIVIGNLTVGGSGKTPLVLWLVERLREQGWTPGIISRGYGGAVDGVQSVGLDSASSLVGDEPLLLARRGQAPVFISRDRVAAGQALLTAHPECNVIISDDGLQHYRLRRTVEIAVFDGRGAGNAQLLPAGPLREPLQRLSAATAVVWNAASEAQLQQASATLALPQFAMRLDGQRFHALTDARQRCNAEDLNGKRLYAMAGIGDPSRFFAQLEALGLKFEAHPFPDHHDYSAADLAFAHDGVLLMTEKDAVKCAALTTREAWVLPVDAQIVAAADGMSLLQTILEKLDDPRSDSGNRRLAR
ncbi:tetraacyldisaccharide 4'-kinase [Propionivibrio sp.]|uniref:tetraacyldisaccharide 4'-kinase n=1 Tax=Propionivibrio sp. TaxID=2212460 RepID=UPI003BF2CA7B